MKIRSLAMAATLVAVAACPSFASAETAPQQSEALAPAFQETIANLHGKSLVGIVVSYPPGGTSRAHYHPRSSFVTAYVLSGAIRSQVNEGKTQVYRAGQHWTEPPGAFHPVSANASATEPASLLAIFVVDTADANRLVTYAPE